MGTAVAMHAARRGHDVTLWGSTHDERALERLRADGKHPSLPEHLPAEVRLFGPGELADASAGAEIAVLGANSHGARSLARELSRYLDGVGVAVSVAKGLEPGTGLRMSQVYGEELTETPIVSIGGPCLASELAQGLPTAGVWAAASLETARRAGSPFDAEAYQLTYTDDVIGVELCAMMKNVAAIGLGMLDGLGKPTGEDFKNAKAALFTKAAHEIVELVSASGGRADPGVRARRDRRPARHVARRAQSPLRRAGGRGRGAGRHPARPRGARVDGRRRRLDARGRPFGR